MENEMDANSVNGVLRAIVPAMLAYVVGKGYITDGTAADITAAVVALSSAIWSVSSNVSSKPKA
jgi:hypothetical protein